MMANTWSGVLSSAKRPAMIRRYPLPNRVGGRTRTINLDSADYGGGRLVSSSTSQRMQSLGNS
jgi:hypothetical protein